MTYLQQDAAVAADVAAEIAAAGSSLRSSCCSCSAATAAAVTGALSKKAASNTLKSVLTYAKGKIIAGACVVAVAGGAAVYNAVKNEKCVV